MAKVPTREQLNAMTDAEYKVYENLIRRMAKRQGLQLEKSRRRDPRAYHYGTYQLVQVTAPGGHWRSRILVAGDHQTGYGMSLDEIHKELL